MIYDYCCNICNHVHEEFHGMLEKPVIFCKCGGNCSKLIGRGQNIMGMAGGRGLYDFVDINTTGQPIRINSKRQWKDHLKRHGLNDDVQNSPYTKAQLESRLQEKNIDKQRNKKEIKKLVVEAYKQRKSPHAKQRVKEVLKKGVANGR